MNERERVARIIYEGITGLPWPPDETEPKYTEDKTYLFADEIVAVFTERNQAMKDALEWACEEICDRPDLCDDCPIKRALEGKE